MHISLAGFSTKWGKRKKKLFGFICEVYASIRYSIVFSTKAFARISLPSQRNYKVPITRQRKKHTASSAKPKNRTKPKGDDKETCTGRDRHPGPPYLHQLHPDQDLLQSTTGAPPTERAHKHQRTRVF
jgi:hypothetical protein